ncbi:hypothetical protein scyTo_0015895, partial [Scyliorhinus torazame]|nr:hypothetical protein [Scyliorhinus torazame]
NAPFSLAAALARATTNEILQSDLSVLHYVPKLLDGTDGITQFDSTRLSRMVFTKLHEVCCSWAKDLPLTRRTHPYFETSIHAIKNMRRKMEDKHVCVPDFNTLFNLENLRCGTTGVVTFMRGNMLHVAWLGDSQVMLVRKGQAVELMKPHKPDREDEKQRIEALGGCVVWFGAWRVNGSLSVSRAIGDAEHKPYICGEADSDSMVLDGTEDYLILACDGFYDTMEPEEAVKVVADHLKENNGDSSMVAHKLVASARDAGSSDNITVIVVFLRDLSASAEDEEEANGDPKWTGNSFDGAPGDGGDDKENRGDYQGPRLQHQFGTGSELAQDTREDSLTDRTSLTLGPQVVVLPQEASAKELPLIQFRPKRLEVSRVGAAHSTLRERRDCAPRQAWYSRKPPLIGRIRRQGWMERPAPRYSGTQPGPWSASKASYEERQQGQRPAMQPEHRALLLTRRAGGKTTRNRKGSTHQPLRQRKVGGICHSGGMAPDSWHGKMPMSLHGLCLLQQ